MSLYLMMGRNLLVSSMRISLVMVLFKKGMEQHTWETLIKKVKSMERVNIL